MNAILPLNIAALRVNNTDQSNLSKQFKGATLAFDLLPYSKVSSNLSSTGDQIYRPMEHDYGAYNRLAQGIHLHWELPDIFRRGQQAADGSDPVFPAAPNRWLVTRYYTQISPTGSIPVPPKLWIVESDFLSDTLPDPVFGSEKRPTISVPLPADPSPGEQPYMYIGRVVNYEQWKPASEDANNYLPSKTGADQKPLYLTAMGFAGPGFSAYYPECCSIFGFWDAFDDIPDVLAAISNNDQTLQFKVSYQVMGWIDDPSKDPLAGLEQKVAAQYNDMLAQYNKESVNVTQTPATVCADYCRRHFDLLLNQTDIPFTCDSNNNILSLTVPEQTICAGIVQEIVWQLDQQSATNGFLLNSDPSATSPWMWTTPAKLAIGNTTAEALSALIKSDLDDTNNDPSLADNFEFLLNAFQLGLLKDLEAAAHPIFELDEKLHAHGFARSYGGLMWMIKEPKTGSPPDPDSEVTLPLEMAEQLYLLNAAQKSYDQGRAQLAGMRQQLFMDWLYYVKLKVGEITDPNIDVVTLANFICIPHSVECELGTVVQVGQSTGILEFKTDPDSGQTIGLLQPDGSGSLADAVWQNYQMLGSALSKYPGWILQCVPAEPFWSAAEPVLLAEGDRIQPIHRNGDKKSIKVRLSTEILGALEITTSQGKWSVAGNQLSGLPTPNAAQPMAADVSALIAEHALLNPGLAQVVGAALASQGGNNNPAAGNLNEFVSALQSAQGGLSPVDGGPGNGLFSDIRQKNYVAVVNPTESVSSPLTISFTFTNSGNTGWAPDAVGWNAQQTQNSFNSRLDPFLPTFMTWDAGLDPLIFNQSPANYDKKNLTEYFELDPDDIEYQNKIINSIPVPFTSGQVSSMKGSVALSKKPSYNLGKQIEEYVSAYPTDPFATELSAISQYYQTKSILSQALNGFNVGQTSRRYLPKITAANLVSPPGRDLVSPQLEAAATANKVDDWYDFHFNNVMPVGTTFGGLFGFGPMRSGFLQLNALEIVDVFGQRMQVLVNGSAGPLPAIIARSLQSPAEDTAHTGKVFFAPRLIPPTRLWFHWLSANFDTKVPGVNSDFVEMNSHPATTPVCGWIVPNHLDQLLAFYHASGAPIGSFGSEGGSFVYITQPGNLSGLNGEQALTADIGASGSPTVNPNLARLMWFIWNKQSTGFINDLMHTFQHAANFINPANHPQDAGLSVFIGRPVAITRAVIGLETAGEIYPLNLSNTQASDPFPSDINAPQSAGRYDYRTRQQFSAGSPDTVAFPLRLGDLVKSDDGLVAFLVETTSSYENNTVYSAAAPDQGANDVIQPADDTITLKLNDVKTTLTLLVDPRAAVHATSGILPVSELKIPPDQYASGMQKLVVSFFINPVLAKRQGLVTPLPAETGFGWNWLQPVANSKTVIPQKANMVDEFARYDYSPQSLLEGWLQLMENKESSGKTK